MVTRVSSIVATTWPLGWEGVEVVDGVVVEEPAPAARARFARPGDGAAVYDRFGRVGERERCGRLVSVLA